MEPITGSALNGINDTLNLIGMSLYASDPTVIGSIHEFRIYSGVVTPSIVALDDAAGPDNLVTNPGPVQALHFSSPVNPLVVNQSSQQILTGDFTDGPRSLHKTPVCSPSIRQTAR